MFSITKSALHEFNNLFCWPKKSLPSPELPESNTPPKVLFPEKRENKEKEINKRIPNSETHYCSLLILFFHFLVRAELFKKHDPPPKMSNCCLAKNILSTEPERFELQFRIPRAGSKRFLFYWICFAVWSEPNGFAFLTFFGVSWNVRLLGSSIEAHVVLYPIKKTIIL